MRCCETNALHNAVNGWFSLCSIVEVGSADLHPDDVVRSGASWEGGVTKDVEVCVALPDAVVVVEVEGDGDAGVGDDADVDVVGLHAVGVDTSRIGDGDILAGWCRIFPIVAWAGGCAGAWCSRCHRCAVNITTPVAVGARDLHPCDGITQGCGVSGEVGVSEDVEHLCARPVGAVEVEVEVDVACVCMDNNVDVVGLTAEDIGWVEDGQGRASRSRVVPVPDAAVVGAIETWEGRANGVVT